MELDKITISFERTHHLFNDSPIYTQRFSSVEKFHNPGLAPVIDKSGSYHITTSGVEAYSNRFAQTFGFYCGLATVEDNGRNGHWLHIFPDGTRAYSNEFDWLGNFQEDKCVAKKNGYFFHINKFGEPIYENKYDYVGDFRDGYAVVYKNDQATHINSLGKLLHKKWFRRLDNFHKGYARARDDIGWFHIDMFGNELYQQRYKEIEPFYNKLALVEEFNGQVKQISMNNTNIHEVTKILNQEVVSELFGDLVGFWKTKLIAIAIRLNLLNLLPQNTSQISSTLKIPRKNLFRLLRALWELDIMNYNHLYDLWELGYKGKVLKNNQYNFLQNAALLWDKVSQLNWNKLDEILLKEEIMSFESFKDIEQNPHFQNAVDGYLKPDLCSIMMELSNISKKTSIVCLGRSSKLLVKEFKKNGFSLLDSITCIDQLYKNTKNYDIAVLVKFIHYFDDKKACEIIDLLSKFQVKEIYIIEMLVSDDNPSGGVLDINMIMECGGMLRNISDFTKILNLHNYNIITTKNINQYLQIIHAAINK